MNYRTIILFSLPLILANISNPLCGIVHSALMGHLPDSKYLTTSAIGITILNSVTYLFYCLRMGTTGVIVQHFGRAEWESIGRVLVQYLLLALLIGSFLIIVKKPIYNFSVTMFHVSDNLLPYLQQYYNITTKAIVLILVKYVFLGFCIAIQKPKAILFQALLSNSFGIISAIILVLNFGYYIDGIASAIVISEIIAVIYYIIVALEFFRSHRVNLCSIFRSSGFRELKSYHELLTINSHIFLRSLLIILSVDSFYIFSSHLGKSVLAANSLILECAIFLAIFLDALASTTQTLVGQYYGNNKKLWLSVLQKSKHCILIAAMLTTAIYGSFCYWIIDQLTTISHIRSIAKQFVVFSVCFPLCASYSFWLDGVCLGLLKTKWMYQAMFKSAIGYVIIVALLWPFGNYGLWLAFLAFFILRSVTLMCPLNKFLTNV